MPDAPRSIAEVPMTAPGEQARGVMHAGAGVPAVRAGASASRLGRALDEHLVAHLASCGRGFSEVAATNPHAWIQEAYTAEEIRTAGAGQPDDRVPVHEAA